VSRQCVCVITAFSLFALAYALASCGSSYSLDGLPVFKKELTKPAITVGERNIPNPHLSPSIIKGQGENKQGAQSLSQAELVEALIDLVGDASFAKRTLRPPLGPLNVIYDFTITDDDGLGWFLNWMYRNAGDYNQDGKVDVADISPLAEHFFDKKVGDNWPHRIDEVIDGNLDGIIDISDLTPIAENIFTEVKNYAIMVSETPNKEDFLVLQIIPFSPGGGIEPVRYKIAFREEEYSYIAVAPLDPLDYPGEFSNIIKVDEIPLYPARFVLLSPENGANGVSQNPTFNWIDSVGEQKYVLEIDDDQEFSEPIFFVAANIGRNKVSYRMTTFALFPGRTYYWRVKAVNSHGERLADNAPYRFTTTL